MLVTRRVSMAVTTVGSNLRRRDFHMLASLLGIKFHSFLNMEERLRLGEKQDSFLLQRGFEETASHSYTHCVWKLLCCFIMYKTGHLHLLGLSAEAAPFPMHLPAGCRRYRVLTSQPLWRIETPPSLGSACLQYQGKTDMFLY